MTTFPDFFKQAVGGAYGPYDFQTRFATAESLPALLRAPTGAGKTATATLGWLWRRRYAPEPIRKATPRRLVFCLPMRSLVSQTERAIQEWLGNLGEDEVGVHTLMGGAVDQSWEMHPDKDCILLGTQDQLLSRALNRGYAMNRYRWSVHFSLLNNDVLWVMDEVQLMGVGLSTSAQLQGFGFPTYGPRHTLWMSATLAEEKLQTVDNKAPLTAFNLTEAERGQELLAKRAFAEKRLQKAEVAFESKAADYAKKLAPFVEEKHRENGGRTLVVVNRVDRAVALVKLLRRSAKDIVSHVVHSRFRPIEREVVENAALADNFEGIVVATQAIEAGVDISSRTLVTDLASWSSMVQRFGRCNRAGEYEQGTDIYWVDCTGDDKDALPYTPEEFETARKLLALVPEDNACPAKLPADPGPHEPASPVLRRRDLLGLFDTTADLSGFDVDVSRYVRDSDGADVQVAWRDWKRTDKQPQPEGNARTVLRREELCRVSIGQFKKSYEKGEWWAWDPLKRTKGQRKRGAWVKGRRAKPGDTVLLHVSMGGYHNDNAQSLGFTAVKKDKPTPAQEPTIEELLEEPEGDGDEPDSMQDQQVTLRDHSLDVREEAEKLRAMIDLVLPWEEVVTASHWHDLGKAHPAWQAMIMSKLATPAGPWAKRKSGKPRASRNERRFFRHELASALAYLQQTDASDLVAYMIAAHHGKVRTAIRSRPEELPDPAVLKTLGLDQGADARLALGVYDGEVLPAADLGAGLQTVDTKLDLSVMTLGSNGAESWVERVSKLLAAYGPYRLAMLESMVRIADWRGSKNPKNRQGEAGGEQ